MNVYHGLDDETLSPRPRSVAIGVFDGVHRGHQKILNKMFREGRRRRLGSMVITFHPHPGKVLHPGSRQPALMSLAHRLKLFERMGVAETLIIPFNRRIASVSREHFLKEVLLRKLGMKALTIGYDFCFGRGGLGDAAFLRRESRRLRFHLSVLRPLKQGREIVSSTGIRRLIETGKLQKARRMLGRPVSVYGTVVHGRGRGRSVGFRTANINPHHETLPPGGVYAAYGYLDGKKLRGVIHLGRRPTFKDSQRSLEVHFLNFRRTIYGKELELVFLDYLRGSQKFQSRERLAEAIQRDIGKAFGRL